MIITDIQSENLLKYRRLELRDLPQKGVVAIGGPNESGKSTVGETICFALFGRSFSLGSEELEKIIRWGERNCSVSLRFRLGDDTHYEVARFLDRDGNHGVRLNLVGEEEQPIARGVEAVDNAVYELLGYGYDEFIESFYLAQREITAPHPHSHAVKTMAGLSSLEYVSYEYEQEIDEQQQAIDIAEEEIATIDEELDELAIDPEALPLMEVKRDSQVSAEAALKTEVEGLEEASNAYQDSIPRIRKARSSRSRARLLQFFALLFSAVLATSWGLLARMPEHMFAQLMQQQLADLVPQWQEAYIPWLLYGALGFGLLFLLLLISAVRRSSAIEQLQKHSSHLAEMLERVHLSVIEGRISSTVESGEDAQSTEIDSEALSGSEALARPEKEEIIVLCRRINSSVAEPSEVRDLMSRELAWLRSLLEMMQGNVVRLDESVRIEKDRLRKWENLNQGRDSFSENITDQRQRIHLRQLGQELLLGASQHLSQRFNRDLRDLVARTLPMFTENRYEHLQIDDDLTVRVFSNEKRDFMDLEEISSGTQRQIMLAVRLALAQELVNSTVSGEQFIFLDEPFAFFDQERTRNSLSVLPNLSDEIKQVWIVAQEFPETQSFDLQLACSRDQDLLKTPDTQPMAEA